MLFRSLDMRFSPDQAETASDWVNDASEEELANVIWQYGEERQSRRIARAIVRSRPIATSLDLAKAVEQAVGLRLRPILMTTLTTIFGMLPLVLIPGPGTELYRGLGAVIVGGMAVSTVFTLILLPSLLRIGEHKRRQPAA